jgi:N6-L-threonylcarbamoyladenine synthase
VNNIIWLGIETSCDETSIALVEDGEKILVNLISSQISLHERFGGVVPELASRKHLEVINPLLEEAMRSARISWNEIGGVAVSYGPGLIGSLLLGVAAAKSIAGILSVPLVGVNHLEGHMYANFLDDPSLPLPCLCLLISGGHTALIALIDHGKLRLLGETRDDAAGECFDKAGRILGLPYPGGPVMDRLAQEGDPSSVPFPRAMLDDTLEFSFSGLKTSMMHFVKAGGMEKHSINDICASFQQSIIEVLVRKSLRALNETGLGTLILAGGVACNSRLREVLRGHSIKKGFRLHFPPPILCTDNAAMIAATAHYMYKRGLTSPLELDALPNLSIEDFR